MNLFSALLWTTVAILWVMNFRQSTSTKPRILWALCAVLAAFNAIVQYDIVWIQHHA